MSGDDWGPTDADFDTAELREAARLNRMKGGARHPRALPAVPMFDDVPAPGPIAPPAPQLDLLRATQEEIPL